MSFKNSPFYNSIAKCREFMYNDIQKSIDLAKKPSTGAPNLLIALGLSCYTEYWGKVSLGIARGDSRLCYESFLCRMGIKYQQLIDNNDFDTYEKIRCGLVHSYLIETNCEINLRRGDCGITIDHKNDKYVFNIITYFEDFKTAVNNYIQGLESGIEDIAKMEKAIRNKPILI